MRVVFVVLFLFLSLGIGCEDEAKEGMIPGECSDDADNDGDGAFDCDDSDCFGAPDCADSMGDTGTGPMDANRPAQDMDENLWAQDMTQIPDSNVDEDLSSPDMAVEPPVNAGVDETVVAFDAEHVYFGGENRRSVDVAVEFPAAEFTYESIQLQFELGCPNGKCDWWDRKGWFAVIENPGQDDETVIEIWRFITPYRVGATWTYDVSGLRPLLTGNRTLRVFIDTWVGTGHANGDGWLVDARFVFKGGVPDKLPIALVAIWPAKRIVYGDPNVSTDPTLSASYTFPPDTHHVEMHMLITGHGQGNAENCAEFCPKTHSIGLGDEWRHQRIWRDDCATTAVPDQYGTYTYPRAGWCPGAYVVPWVEDFTGFAAPGQTVDLRYKNEAYVNTCRPDSEQCSGCVFGTTCDYNGQNHTEPTYLVSGLLVVYSQ